MVPGVVNHDVFLTLATGTPAAGQVKNLLFSVNEGASFQELPELTFSDNGVANAYVIRDAIEALAPGFVGQYNGELFLAAGKTIQFAIGGVAENKTAADAAQVELTTLTGLSAEQLGSQAYK